MSFIKQGFIYLDISVQYTKEHTYHSVLISQIPTPLIYCEMGTITCSNDPFLADLLKKQN